MTDLDQLLPLWEELTAAGVEYVLATVIEVEGSGYRKPGARMLVGADGRRAGTISGGCLEGEVARKAFWHTEHGPVVRRYSTRSEDGEVPFGMGCGGVIQLLLERSATARPLMSRLSVNFKGRRPIAVATVLEGERIGQRAYFDAEAAGATFDESAALIRLAEYAAAERRSFSERIVLDDGDTALVRVEWLAARPGLFVFGAGDDALPMVKLARQLGWYVAVADGRSHLATRTRFAEAHRVEVLGQDELPDFGIQPRDAAVVMTHSLEQDERVVAMLLEENPAYIGVLGPRRRTMDLLTAIAEQRTLKGGLTRVFEARQIDAWLGRLHAPMGLDLGGDTPAEIALAVIAEIQQTLRSSSGRPLREVRRAAAEAMGRLELASSGTEG